MRRDTFGNLINESIDEISDISEREFIKKMWKMANSWKDMLDMILFMDISEKTEIKIRKIMENIGEGMTEICDIMIKENNKKAS